MAPSDLPVVIVGGGAAAAFLLHQLSADGAPRRPVVVVDPAERLGPGVAYGTADPVHLMNVCRIRLSVDGDNGADLVGWLGERGVTATADTYLRRSMYGDYLADVAARSGSAVGVEHRRNRVVGLARTEAGWRVALDDGTAIDAGDVVLATGFPGRPALPCAVPEGDDPRVVVDPWAPGALDRPDARRVVVVGTGLTMVDVALSLASRNPDVELVAASRRGLVPRTSRPGLPTPIAEERLPTPGIGGRALVRHVVKLGRAEEDWQAVIDSVRPRANDLWRALPYGDQARMLRRWFPWWNVHRHRTAPAVGAGLAATIARGQLRIVRSRVDAVAPGGPGARLSVRFADPSIDDLDADLVVNAAGPSDDLTASGSPVLQSLLDDGHVVIGPHRLGLAVDRAGHALGRGVEPTPGLWIIGALRRGTEWETTAVPEIRIQAGVIADRLLHGDSEAEDTPVEVGRC
ncbi:FAD/NAD(P)-binding protein [Aquihabitans sp. G128]|uniref:FAD/NAD(P)-binding protein n=1 Tax=Aquihabitans sp. G128 TaxID=2849779 RepID=UPI001C22DE5D|nr:FAD/NAD(P)-binding protein [Aquihabitans sp. G128]QXC63325.1 FAD/NAD(P)-binding protein [Aquihabitans sp. G128]